MSDGAEAVLATGELAEARSPARPKMQRVRKQRLRAAWKPLLADLGLGAVLPAIVLAAWQAAGSAGLISDFFLPAPLAILKSLAELTVSGELIRHLGISMGRAGLGFLLGGALGLLFGIVNGLFRKAEYLLDPVFQVLRLVPHLAIAPLIILWFGFGETSKITIITSGAFFPLYINTFLGIRQVDGKLLEVGRVLGFGTYDRLRCLVLPAALPNILLGLRLSFGVAWIGLVVAELIGAQSGVGFLINQAKQNSDTAEVFVGILIFAVTGKMIDSVVRLLERRMLLWRDSYKG
ncbi:MULTISPECIES: ABC transporter permease [unclassified Paenibacillus]|uniref:ABC transporter permease n=1 Tax=unclassified Paenibacillus TaxID=185978 RepID=UPI0024061CBC|nr:MULTISPECIES: ABC transporter permease [unclassified Paenibacillus]MDF9844570.1 sulfonate transport system permease protein [Paenibacillus sp. PastF-2]MDF9851145.1 sulfonate transport system permease protein [Paenibacillus sp. PastM-2]MDF9856220.1 sulfonate transport system permease protein [Paenibacillus sp. PastF-1]MDH6481551.1 sulfonate transport system permease protein [Paenibacillus sp. PastH-2]MDH6510435.1 sulfonate transport system permease protein [Paenibacillus sp. PastM-3]